MDKKNNAIALVSTNDLSLVENNLLNGAQLKILLAKTPKKYIHQRPAKGGGKWDFVTGGYMKKVLNLMFGWDWDFEIIKDTIHLDAGQVIVHGQLTVRVDKGERIASVIKHQYGRADIKFRKGTKTPVDLGNDMKAAATDALKKCAAELGVAADIYNKQDFQELRVGDITKAMLMEIYMEKESLLNEPEKIDIDRIIKNEETASYTKAFNWLKKIT